MSNYRYTKIAYIKDSSDSVPATVVNNTATENWYINQIDVTCVNRSSSATSLFIEFSELGDFTDGLRIKQYTTNISGDQTATIYKVAGSGLVLAPGNAVRLTDWDGNGDVWDVAIYGAKEDI